MTFVLKFKRETTDVPGIAVDGSGNSYVTGGYRGPAIFGSGEPNETQLPTGATGIFVAKYSDGTIAWAKWAGGTGIDEGYGIAVDGSGNSYVTGNYPRHSNLWPRRTKRNPTTPGNRWR